MDFPIRYLILALIILASSVIQMSRLNLNVAIVAMVRKPIKDSNETKIVKGSCPLPKVDNEEHLNSTKRTRTDSPIYDWSESDQGILLGSFFYSYVAMQIPGVRTLMFVKCPRTNSKFRSRLEWQKRLAVNGSSASPF